MRKKRLFTNLAVVLVTIGLMIGGTESLADKISRPFKYSGYTFPDYKSYQKDYEFVTMVDGTKLALDVYLPSNGPTGGPFPAVIFYTPYIRATINPQTGNIAMFFSPFHDQLMQTFTSYGYAVVVADMRGTGASYGSRVEMSPQLAEDGKQLIDWIESQPWSDGNVGMYGGSYMGWSQFAVASELPNALKCIMPEVMAFDMYEGFHYPGGIINRLLVNTWGPRQIMFDRSLYNPAAGLFPAAPVVDEDNDGDLVDEIPLDLNGNGTILDDYNPPDKPPQYSDGKARQHIYYNALVEHLNNIYPHQFVPGAPYRDSILPGLGYGYSELHPRDWPIHISKSGIPIYNIGGWFDIFTRETTRWYATMNGTNASKLLMHPSFHSLPGYSPPSMVGPYWQYFGEDINQASSGFRLEKIRFFDRCLKGVENGIEKEPPIYIYVMNGSGWRFENAWPLTRELIENFYLEEGKTLSKTRTTTGTDDYIVDFTHSSMYGTNNMTRWRATVDQVMKRTDKDLKCLTYTSLPLEQDTEVTGHPLLHLWVSSTADNGDFFVYLEDIDGSGEAYYVTEGHLRANFAGLVSSKDILSPGANIDVKPDLPWHGFKQSDYVDGIFAGGKKVELVIDLQPTSWVFKKGHRIRVSIAGADWPTFDLHPMLSPNNNPSDPTNIVPTITAYRDAQHPSRIELPVIPRKPVLFEGTAKIKSSSGKYEGPAELYTFRNDVYLHYEDQWIKWEVIENWQTGSVEHYKGEGELGNLSVLVQNNDKASFDVLATGQGVHFKGNAKQ